jgi:hypothetical protein
MQTLSCTVVLVFASAAAGAQVLTPRVSAPAPVTPRPLVEDQSSLSVTVPLTVPAGTTLKVALDKEVRIRHVGQAVYARLVDSVYAFDKPVVPAGSEVSGKISAIETATKRTRVLSALNADLSPFRKVTVNFDAVRLADGRTVPLSTAPSTGSSGTLRFVSASGQPAAGTVNTGKHTVGKKVNEVGSQAKQEWNRVLKQLHEPGKVHRVERMAMAELPYHPQYLEAGTAFDVRLTQPLDFGYERVSGEAFRNVGTPPPSGSEVHAFLASSLSSATSKKGDPVEAVVTQPVIAAGRLYVLEGSRLIGNVLQVRPARRLARNGRLRIAFHELLPPSGSARQIKGSLEGIAVTGSENLKLDSESGARATAPKTRYFSTAIALALATSSSAGDREDRMQGTGADAGPSAANGASGFKVVGMVLGALAHSRAVSTGMGVYGAAMSVYSHFLRRGRDVVYPEGMGMIIGLGTHEEHAAATTR